MKICVVNFAEGSRYVKGQKRLKQTFLDNGYTGDFAFYSNVSELNCPKHEDIPYAFKAYALFQKLEEDYDILIWADSLMMLVKPFKNVLDYILEHGSIFPLNGWTTGEWCADTALEPLGITREESFTYPHLMACVMAFDCRKQINKEFLVQYYKRASDGITFVGDWKNDKHQVSDDDRVLGHRHDQTAASIIGHRLGIQFDEHLVSYGAEAPVEPKTILFLNNGAI